MLCFEPSSDAYAAGQSPLIHAALASPAMDVMTASFRVTTCLSDCTLFADLMSRLNRSKAAINQPSVTLCALSIITDYEQPCTTDSGDAGNEAQESKHGLLTTIGYQLGPQEPPQYALEGSIAIGGAGVSWLRDQLGLIESAEESEAVASSVENTAGEAFAVMLTL